MSWAALEFRELDLGDKCREARAVLLAERLADKPTASLPDACSGWAETQGAYRLFRQETFDGLDPLEPHRVCTAQRMAAHAVVLCFRTSRSWTSTASRSRAWGRRVMRRSAGCTCIRRWRSVARASCLEVLDAWM